MVALVRFGHRHGARLSRRGALKVPNAQRHVSHGSLGEEARRRRPERRGQSPALRALDIAPVRAPDSRSATRPLRTRSERLAPPSLPRIAQSSSHWSLAWTARARPPKPVARSVCRPASRPRNPRRAAHSLDPRPAVGGARRHGATMSATRGRQGSGKLLAYDLSGGVGARGWAT